MKKAKKVLMVITIVLMTVLMLSMGGQEARPSAGETLTPTGRLTVQVFDRGTDGGRSLAHDNAWTNWIKEKVKADLNIDITFIPVGRWSETTDIVNLMAAGPNSAPDLCYTYGGGMVEAFRDMGGVMDLAPYIDSHLPDLKKLLGSDPAFPDKDFIYRNADRQTGRIYSIPSYRVAVAQRNVFIRKDWLDALGMPVPTTYDQFYRTLVAFRDRDPGNVGRTRVVPFGVNEDARWGLADLIHHHINPRMSDRDRWVNNIADRNIMMDGYKRGV